MFLSKFLTPVEDQFANENKIKDKTRRYETTEYDEDEK
jgi:hypothetical protein